MKSSVIGVSAAISAIKRRQQVRVYAETPGLKLLGLEDKHDARIKWKTRVAKPVTEDDRRNLDNVREELARRLAPEMEEARAEFKRRTRMWSLFPDEGPLRRELYPKHMQTVGFTKDNNEVLMMAANKVGKSDLGAYCVTAWLTGRYPHWWHGRRFDYPTAGWVCNQTSKDCRDINEEKLLGPIGNEAERGTGMIPSHLIQKCTPKPGVPHGFEIVAVEHVSGATSYVTTKSYDQGRTAFQGRNQHFIWNDEEVTKEIYGEELLRIMIVDIAPEVKASGVILNTYTPINGLTELTTEFMESAGLSIEALRNAQESGEEVVIA